MKAPSIPAMTMAVSALALFCAPRPQLCSGPGECAKDFACVTGQCLRDGAIPAISESRRIVLAPEDAVVLEPGEPPSGGALPTMFTLGRASERGSTLLLSFDLHLRKIKSILRASVLLDRCEGVFADPVPISLHAEAILAPWDARRVRSSTAPPLEDVRSPRTVVWSSGRAVVRVDVTELAQRWLARDSPFHGVAIVAENTSPTGVAFAIGALSVPELDSRGPAAPRRDRVTEPPRLELYVQ
jgi:hypothetical protein